MAWSTLFIVGGAFVLRVLLIPLNLYRSTDFEVHRNWLAITYSLPVSRWYFEDTSQWTLDYPFVFACFEWALSQVAALVDPNMLLVKNLEYASHATVVFQRLSVVCVDLVLATGAWRAGGTGPASSGAKAAVALVLLNPGLLIVDHIHFQYNGMLLGLLLHSAADIEKGRICRGAVLFCVLLNAKQIFLYVAPVYFLYLLRGLVASRGVVGLQSSLNMRQPFGSGAFDMIHVRINALRMSFRAQHRSRAELQEESFRRSVEGDLSVPAPPPSLHELVYEIDRLARPGGFVVISLDEQTPGVSSILSAIVSQLGWRRHAQKEHCLAFVRPSSRSAQQS